MRCDEKYFWEEKMNKSRFFKLTLLILTLCCFICLNQAQSLRGTGRLAGIVVDESGKPVPNAKVRLEFSGLVGRIYEKTITNIL